MPFALIFVGLVLIAAGVHDNTTQLFQLVKGDIEGSNGEKGYVYWLVAILILGSLGYIEELKPISRAFMALVIVVLLLKTGNPNGTGGGFFAQFFAALGQNPQNTGSTSSTGIEQPLAPARPAVSDYPINLGPGQTGIFHGTASTFQDYLNQAQ